MKQRIIDLINKVPKSTTVVRAEIMDLGISKDKLKRWKHPSATVSAKDALTLTNYFRDYTETGVESMDDLFIREESEEQKLAEELGLGK